MKRIRRIRQMYKAHRLNGVKEKEIVARKGRYYVVRRLWIDHYGITGFDYCVARDFGRKLKYVPVDFSDRGLDGCLCLLRDNV